MWHVAMWIYIERASEIAAQIQCEFRKSHFYQPRNLIINCLYIKIHVHINAKGVFLFKRLAASHCTCRPNEALPDAFCVPSLHARGKAARCSRAPLHNWKRNLWEDTPQSHHPAQAWFLANLSRTLHLVLLSNHLSLCKVSQYLLASLLWILRGRRWHNDGLRCFLEHASGLERVGGVRVGKGLGSRVFEQHHKILSKASKRSALHIETIINVALLRGATLVPDNLIASWTLRDIISNNIVELFWYRMALAITKDLDNRDNVWLYVEYEI